MLFGQKFTTDYSFVLRIDRRYNSAIKTQGSNLRNTPYLFHDTKRSRPKNQDKCKRYCWTDSDQILKYLLVYMSEYLYRFRIPGKIQAGYWKIGID